MRIYADFTYQEEDSIRFRPVIFKAESEEEAKREFCDLSAMISRHYKLLESNGPEIVTMENEARILERAEAFSRAYEGKETMLFV